jgi:hypothetical protein
MAPRSLKALVITVARTSRSETTPAEECVAHKLYRVDNSKTCMI